MDVSLTDGSTHLDADVLLPPRKRLLAGLKRQSCSESTSQCSQSPSLSPSPSSQPPLTEFDIRLNNLLKSYKHGSSMSPEEIAKAASSAALAAAKAAEAARAAAEEKAALAARAVASAKTALDLVASVSDDAMKHHQRKSRGKKQVAVQVLYSKHQAVENCGKDEELARKLHHAINSSPRILKSSPGCEKQKKPRVSPSKDETGAGYGNLKLSGGVDNGGSSEETHSVKMDEYKVAKGSKTDEAEVTSQPVQPKVKNPKPSEDGCVTNGGRKRGRIKQKKLPLSICSFKDQTNPKEHNVKRALFKHSKADKSSIPSPSCEPVGADPTWKCQGFEVPRCIKPRDKTVHS